MSKQYKKLLPVSDDSKVITQFGRLPLSIMEFKNSSKWNCAYFDQDDSEKRRSDDCEYLPGLGMSEFSSEVCEFILRYWSMKNSIVVDPFAGRATRAVISSKLSRQYYGYEISPLTYNRSIEHYKKVGVIPKLYLADGCDLYFTDNDFAHLVMTCPPYFSIEKYEDVEGQLSSCDNYESFLSRITQCAANINRVLKPGGFCCWVCADWRDSKGFRQFSNDSINIFKSVGMIPHDTIIIKNNSPFAALQAGKAASKRISSKIHEFILVFRKEGELDITGLESDDINEKSNEFFG
jgi:DNA modification methylase